MDEKSTATLVKYGVLAFGAYIAYQIYKELSDVGNAAGNAVQKAGDTVGGAIFNMLNPNAAGASVTYVAKLPNGQAVGVNNNSLDSSGQTVIGGQTYQMMVNPNITTGINKTLVPVPSTDDALQDYWNNLSQ